MALFSPAWNLEIVLGQMPLFEVLRKCHLSRDFIQKMSQALSKCLSKWIKVDKWDYLKNTSDELKKSFCLGFL